MPGYPILTLPFSENGDGTGVTNANGNYSALPLSLKIAPPESQNYKIGRIMIELVGTGNFKIDEYGNGPPLDNGIVATVENPSGVLYTLTAFPIQTTMDWAGHCYDLTILGLPGNVQCASVAWSFEHYGTTVRLRGDDGHFMRLLFQDDLTALDKHRFMAQGFISDDDLDS